MCVATKSMATSTRPRESAVRNQADRFSLAIDAIDRIPRFRVMGSSAREALLNEQIACKNHAYEFEETKEKQNETLELKWVSHARVCDGLQRASVTLEEGTSG